MTVQEQTPSLPGFTIGICATGRVKGLEALTALIESESKATPVSLRRIIIVASGCDSQTISKLTTIANRDSRIELILEGERHGKADAINKILERAEGEFIVFVNSDAMPEQGSLRSLLSMVSSSGKIGGVSAMPILGSRGGVASDVSDLMWTTHNECSLILNHMNISNHSSDEMVVFRASAVEKLPEGLVNDGAFLAAVARRRGYAIKFCVPARVRVETPTRLADMIGQRRRILFGHAQVWRAVGRAPRTIESLMVFSPSLGFRLLVRTFSKHPRFLAILPVALVVELSAALLSIWDGARSSRRHAIWRRYA